MPNPSDCPIDIISTYLIASYQKDMSLRICATTADS